MENEKLQKLTQLIQNSSILNPAEKEEWQILLPYMNDKQLLELERILTTKVADSKPVSQQFSSNRLPGPTLPDYKEKELTTSKQFFQTEITAPLVRPIAPAPKLGTVFKNIPKPMSVAVPVTPSAQSVPVSEPRVVETQKLQKHTPTVVPEPQHIGGSVVSQSSAKTFAQQAQGVSIKLQSPVDLSALTPGIFRTLDPSDFLGKLIQLIKKTDYYQVKFALEESLLYQNYIYIGKTLLEAKHDYNTLQSEVTSSGRECMTQLEFERFTDILSAIQINQ